MDARRVLGTFCYCIAALPSSSVPALSLRAGCDRNGSNAPCTGLRRMAESISFTTFRTPSASTISSIALGGDRASLDEVMPDQRRPLQLDEAAGAFPEKLEFLNRE